MSLLLSVDDLSTEYRIEARTVVGLSSINFELAGGRTLGVLGESGSGKSTLLHAVLGLLPPSARITRGRIAFEGVDVVAAPASALPYERGVVGAVFQDVDTALDGELAAGDPLLLLCRRQAPDWDTARTEARRQLERLGVSPADDCLSLQPRELALGVRQRLLLAMALATKPRLLVLDCPTSILDVLTRAWVLKELSSIQAELGIAMLIASNDPVVLSTLAHEVLVLHAGEVVEQGATRDVLHDAAHPYTRALLASLAPTERDEIPVLTRAYERDQNGNGCSFAPRCQHRLGLPDGGQCKARRPELLEQRRRRVRCFFPVAP